MWEAETIVEIDDEAYYDYQVNRPVIRQVDGVTRELVWPSMRISHCRPPGSDRDIVLMHGVEPNMRWRTFCAELLAIADKLNVDTVVILGALLADTPHTRPRAGVRCRVLVRFGEVLRPGGDPVRGPPHRYRRGVPGRVCAGRDPGGHVLGRRAALRLAAAQSEGHRALLRRVEDVLDIEVPLGDLITQSEEWEQAVTEMTAEDEEIAEYVQSLEERGGTRGGYERGARKDRRGGRPGGGVRALPAQTRPVAADRPAGPSVFLQRLGAGAERPASAATSRPAWAATAGVSAPRSAVRPPRW